MLGAARSTWRPIRFRSTARAAPFTPAGGFTGHGVGPSNLGGRILSGLALGADDETTRCPLVEPKVKYFPPEPARSIGGNLIRAALIRRDEVDARGEKPDPITTAITKLPKLIGMNLPR